MNALILILTGFIIPAALMYQAHSENDKEAWIYANKDGSPEEIRLLLLHIRQDIKTICYLIASFIFVIAVRGI